MAYKISISLKNDYIFAEKVKLYGGKPKDSAKDPKPPGTVEDIGFYAGMKHSDKDYFLAPGNVTCNGLCYLYSGVFAVNGNHYGFAYFATTDTLATVEEQGTARH